MTIASPIPSEQPIPSKWIRPVVLTNVLRRDMRNLLAAMDALGIIRVKVRVVDDGHYCDCELCNENRSEFNIWTVALVYARGAQETFFEDELADERGDRALRDIPLPMLEDCIDDLLWEIPAVDDFDWVTIETSQILCGGREVVKASGGLESVRDWTCDLRATTDDGDTTLPF